MSDRFYVLQCCLISRAGAPIYVIDRAYGHRIVARYDNRSGRGAAVAQARADKLNEWDANA